MATRTFTLAALFLTAVTLPAAAQEKVVGPYRVKIQEEKEANPEPILPLDAKRRAEFQMLGGLNLRITAGGKLLHAGYLLTSLKIDDQVQHNGPWRIEAQNIALPKTAGGKQRDGFYSVYTAGKLRITHSVELVPGLKPGTKERLLDTVLVRYTIENKDFVPHRVGLRKFMNVHLIDSDAAIFAAPNQPNKLLDGVVLKGKTMPDYLQILQHPNLKEPGYVAHMTFSLGSNVDRPDRAVLTWRGAAAQDNWTVDAVAAGGSRVMYLYWDPREIKPGGKRELAFAYGGGVAGNLENEGRVKFDLSGSLEPGKRFTINASVSEPALGQSLTLELPANMELVHGQETQPVPPANQDGNSMVQWQARVLRTGNSSVRIHSSTGVTHAKTIDISRADGK
jgi:predicted secreted protein